MHIFERNLHNRNQTTNLVYGHTDRRTDIRINERTYGQTDRPTYGHVDRQTDICKHRGALCFAESFMSYLFYEGRYWNQKPKFNLLFVLKCTVLFISQLMLSLLENWSNKTKSYEIYVFLKLTLKEIKFGSKFLNKMLNIYSKHLQ